MQDYVEQTTLPTREYRRRPRHRRRQQGAVADDAEAARTFGYQHVAAGQEGERPGIHQTLGDRHHAVIVHRGALNILRLRGCERE